MITAKEAYDLTTQVIESYGNGDLLGGDPMCWIKKYAEDHHEDKMKAIRSVIQKYSSHIAGTKLGHELLPLL